MFVTWFFFFKQKTAYEMRISDWSSDVCSSDLRGAVRGIPPAGFDRSLLFDPETRGADLHADGLCDRWHHVGGSRAPAIARRRRSSEQIGRASCRERVCQYV